MAQPKENDQDIGKRRVRCGADNCTIAAQCLLELGAGYSGRGIGYQREGPRPERG
jgi:hypothetical protein